MTSATDIELIDACRRETRCLVTLDLDFANPLRFPPADYSGIAVLRPHGRANAGDLVDLVVTLAEGLSRAIIAGKLWIVEPDRPFTRIRSIKRRTCSTLTSRPRADAPSTGRT